MGTPNRRQWLDTKHAACNITIPRRIRKPRKREKRRWYCPTCHRFAPTSEWTVTPITPKPHKPRRPRNKPRREI